MDKKFEVANVSTRGQITIPQDIRDTENIKEVILFPTMRPK